MRRSAKSKSEVKTPMVFSAQFLSKERAKKLNLKKSQTKTGGEQNGPSFCDQKKQTNFKKINTESWKEIISFQATTEEKGGWKSPTPPLPKQKLCKRILFVHEVSSITFAMTTCDTAAVPPEMPCGLTSTVIGRYCLTSVTKHLLPNTCTTHTRDFKKYKRKLRSYRLYLGKHTWWNKTSAVLLSYRGKIRLLIYFLKMLQ